MFQQLAAAFFSGGCSLQCVLVKCARVDSRCVCRVTWIDKLSTGVSIRRLGVDQLVIAPLVYNSTPLQAYLPHTCCEAPLMCCLCLVVLCVMSTYVTIVPSSPLLCRIHLMNLLRLHNTSPLMSHALCSLGLHTKHVNW